MIQLSQEMAELLRLCLSKRKPCLLWVLDEPELVSVGSDLGNALRDVVGEELLERGFDGDVPNSYGLRLEQLIDDIGDLFLRQNC